MDYEKKYKAILETATQWIKDGCTDKERICLESVFPELRESEDERVRKIITDSVFYQYGAGVEYKDVLDYLDRLEKQKEPNAELMEKFNKGLEQAIMWGREGCKVSPNGEVKILNQDEIDDVIKKQKESLHISGTCKENADSFTDSIIEVRSFQRGIEEGRRLEKQKEQKPVECADDVVEEAEEYTSKVACGDYGVEVTEAYIAGVLSERNRGTKWSEEDKEMLLSIINAFRNGTVSTIGQEQWLKSLPKRFNLQSKQEWSKEDEKRLEGAIKVVDEPQKPIDYDHEMWKNCEANFEGGKKEVINNPEKYGLQKTAKWSEEDEKIRKALIWHLKADVDFVSNGVTKAECLAYLDKQKAQKQEWSKENIGKQVEQIRNEVERRRDFFYERYVKKGIGCIEESRYDECVEILSFIDSLPDCTVKVDGQGRVKDDVYDSLTDGWKPSEEQMSALNYFITLWGNSDDQLEYTKIFNTVKSLRDDLEKQM